MNTKSLSTGSEYKDSQYYEKEFLDNIYYTEALFCTPEVQFEIHVLACSRYATMTLWSLKTFCKAVGCVPPIILHDDGTLQEGQIKMFRFHLRGATILTNKGVQQDNCFRVWLDDFPALKYWRWTVDNVFGRRLLDFNFFATKPYIVVFDSDVLFFKSSAELDCAIADRRPFIMEDSIDAYYPSQDHLNRILGVPLLKRANGGLWGMPTALLERKRIEEFFLKTSSDPQMENFNWAKAWLDQTILSVLLGGNKEALVLAPKSHGISFRRITPETCSHHFPGDASRVLYHRLGLRTLDDLHILTQLGYRLPLED